MSVTLDVNVAQIDGRLDLHLALQVARLEVSAFGTEGELKHAQCTATGGVWIKNVGKDSRHRHWFLASVGMHPLSSHIDALDGYCLLTDEDGLYLDDLAVSKHARRRGVASALLRAVRAFAQGREIVTKVLEDSEAEGFYKTQGFVAVPGSERPSNCFSGQLVRTWMTHARPQSVGALLQKKQFMGCFGDEAGMQDHSRVGEYACQTIHGEL